MPRPDYFVTAVVMSCVLVLLPLCSAQRAAGVAAPAAAAVGVLIAHVSHAPLDLRVNQLADNLPSAKLTPPHAHSTW